MLACGCVSAMPGHVSCVHEPVCLLWMGALWDLLGQFLENQLPNSKTHRQQLDLAFPCSLPDVTNLCLCPEPCRMV